MALAKALGRKDFATAIELARSGLTGTARDTENLTSIAQYHVWLSQELEAIEAAHQALQLDADCFEAHRILTHIYATRRDHRLGLLHCKNALRLFQPTPRIPAWLESVAVFIAWLRRGRSGADAERRSRAAQQGYDERWLEWARHYVVCDKHRDALVPANEVSPLYPVPGP